MSELNIRIGKVFKKLRADVGLDQSDVSNMLQIPRTALSLLESGKRDISLSEFDKLCRIYRIAPNDALGWKRTKAKENIK